MQRNVFSFIWRFSRLEQIYVLFLTVASFPFLYYSLELPKIIVNEAIQPGQEAGSVFTVAGFEFEQVPYLFVLSGMFLALVFVNGGFKYYINVYRGRLGERMLRRLRYELYLRVLRFRLPRFKRMSQGEIIPMITQEVEPVGGFVGDAFALPAFQGGTLLVYLVFIFMQDPILGAAAIAFYPLQAYLIPKLQYHVNQLGKRRVRAVRQLSDKVGETVAGTGEVLAHDTANYHLADYTNRLGEIYDIRYEIFRRKFFIKFLNNFINQITPFFFYSIGGYLVIQGDLSFGALVAVLAAYKDLSGPWRELLNYYQRTEDIRIKYDQVVQQFQPEDIMPEEQIHEDRPLTEPLSAEITLSNVTFAEDDAVPSVDGVTLTLNTHTHVAVLGGSGSGKEELTMLLARLLVPSSGRLLVGGQDMADLPNSIVGRAIGYVGPAAHMFTDSLRANMYYGLKHRPLKDPVLDEAEQAIHRRRLADALAAGNSGFDIGADWIDYEAASATGPEDLEARALEILALVELDADVYRMGLNGTIDPTVKETLADRILKARLSMRGRLEANEGTMSSLVELYEQERYNDSATVAENVLFGTPVGHVFALDGLADNPYMQQVLEKTSLTEDFVEMGGKVAATMLELFADLPPGHEFFEQFSFISSEDLPDYQPLVARIEREGTGDLRAEDRRRLMALPFKLIPSRHRLGLIDDTLQERLLAARKMFAADLPAEWRESVEFFDPAKYNAASSLLDNILFGKIRYGQSGIADKVQAMVAEVVAELDLRDDVIAIGLDRSVGVAGARLSTIQRQKLALARALLKQPDLLILNQATGALDGGSQARIHAELRRRFQGKGLVWAPHRPGLAEGFDDVVVMAGGKIAQRGSFNDLAGQQGGALATLLESE